MARCPTREAEGFGGFVGWSPRYSFLPSPVACLARDLVRGADDLSLPEAGTVLNEPSVANVTSGLAAQQAVLGELR